MTGRLVRGRGPVMAAEPGLLTPLEANMSCGGSVIIRHNVDNFPTKNLFLLLKASHRCSWINLKRKNVGKIDYVKFSDLIQGYQIWRVWGEEGVNHFQIPPCKKKNWFPLHDRFCFCAILYLMLDFVKSKIRLKGFEINVINFVVVGGGGRWWLKKRFERFVQCARCLYIMLTLQHVHFVLHALCIMCSLQHKHLATHALCNTCTSQYIKRWVQSDEK